MEEVLSKNIIIRQAVITDLKDIQNLNKVLFDLEYENYDSTLDITWPISKEGIEYFKKAIENNITLVAVIENKIFGYLIGSLNTQNSYNKTIQAELDNMCVLEQYRKLGIGSKLFNKFKEICKECLETFLTIRYTCAMLAICLAHIIIQHFINCTISDAT